MKRALSFVLALVLLVGLMPMQAFGSTLTIDSIAWEDLTYREIFITNNLAYLNGFDHNNWGAYKQYAGTNIITNEACFSEPYSLKAAGSTSQQIVSSTTNQAGDYFVASKVNCTRYAKGELGVCLQDTTVGVTAVTNGFVTSSGIVTMPGSHRIFIGSIHSADLDGYVDDTAVVNMNIFATRPSCEEMTLLYEQYVQIEKNRDRTEVIYTDAQMLDAFMKYLKNKAATIGMDSSVFEDPVGNSCNWVTARDVAKLLIYANHYEQLHGIWSQTSKEITVTGENARTKIVVSTVIEDELEQYYHILGGKTGTLGNTRNLSVILEIPDSDDKLAVVALCANGQNGTSESRYQAVKQIADAAIAKYRDPSVDNSAVDVCCASAIACLVPADGADLKNLTVLYEKDADTRRNPASITKVLTAVCALDILKSLEVSITYKQFDITTCPWNSGDFYPGDTMTLGHTLFALLLPSNDVTAFTVARSAGEALLKDVHTHSYTPTVIAPTCTERGYTTHSCNCGDSYVDDYVDATGKHSYENGTCTACGHTNGPVITQQAASVQQEIGKKFAITVKAEGEGLSYQWYVKEAGAKAFKVSSNKTASYAYTMQTYMHNRQVYCVITDQYGNQVTTETATITRSALPVKITQQPADVSVAMGDTFSVTVKAEGDDLTYQWYYKNAGGKSFAASSIKKSSYSSKMVSYMVGRQVYCVVTDKYGNQVTSDVATIKLPAKELKILTQPEDVHAPLGQKFSVAPEVQGEGLTYQWYYKNAGGKSFAASSNKTAAYAYSMQSYMNGRQVYCVITDQLGNQVTTETVTLHLVKD